MFAALFAAPTGFPAAAPFAALAWVAACSFAASAASAQPGGAAAVSPEVSPPFIDWNVPAGCPDARTVDDRARSLASADAATWARAGQVRGRIVGGAGDWMLALQIERAASAALPPAAGSGPSREAAPARVFHAGDCSELGEAAAVAIALALGGADAASAAAADAGAAADANAPAPAHSEAPHDEGGASLASELRTIGAAARAEALLDTASLGGLALGVGGEAGARWRALGLRVYGLGLPSREVRLAPSQTVELSLWAAGLRGCYRASAGLPHIDVCGGAEVGAFGAAGRGLADARERHDLWAASTWGTWFGLDLAEHLQAGARVEAVIPLSRARYFVNGDDLVHEMREASLRLALSLGGTLGSE